MVTSRIKRAALAASTALIMLTGVAAASAPAQAAPQPDGLFYSGASLNSARLPAGPVVVEFRSSTPARSVDFILDGTKVATDTQLDRSGENWIASAVIDLRGKQGQSQLRTHVFAPQGFRAFFKFFKVVPLQPTAPARLSGAPVAGATNTGVPQGTALRASGPLTLTRPGEVVEGLDVQGCVVVAANDVVIRKSRITCTDPAQDRALRTSGAVSGLVVEDVEIDGGGVVDIGADVSGAVLRRLDVHGVNDGVRLGSRVSLLDSWVHGLVRQNGLHPDAVQGISAQDVLIQGNTLDPRSTDGKDLGNAAVMLGSETGTKLSRDVVVRDNFLEGGNYAVNVSGSINAQRIDVSGNLFGTASRYGAVVSPPGVVLGAGNLVGPARLPVFADRPSF